MFNSYEFGCMINLVFAECRICDKIWTWMSYCPSEISNSSFQSKPSNTQLTLTCSKSTIETLEKEAKYAQS